MLVCAVSDSRVVGEQGWRAIGELDRRLAAGDLDEAGWHRELTVLVTRALLTPAGAASASGSEGRPHVQSQWEMARRPLMSAIDSDGTLLDVGCGSGLLMQLIHQWSVGQALLLEPYGVEISPALADLARHRSPQWKDRIFTADILNWVPPMRFDYVRANLHHVSPEVPALMARWLLETVVSPHGRLIVGVYVEAADAEVTLESRLQAEGLSIAGRSESPTAEPGRIRRITWIDQPGR